MAAAVAAIDMEDTFEDAQVAVRAVTRHVTDCLALPLLPLLLAVALIRRCVAGRQGDGRCCGRAGRSGRRARGGTEWRRQRKAKNVADV